jgi:Ca-activated chloride channel family protein
VTSPVQLNLAPAGIDPPPVAIRLSHGITPRGKTPLTDAVVEPAETLSFRDYSATVVLTSDGIESCQADLVALMLTGLASIGPARTAFSGTTPPMTAPHTMAALLAPNASSTGLPRGAAREPYRAHR